MTETSESPPHRFLIRMVEDLARGDVSFPTYLDAALKIRTALGKPDLSVDELSRVVLSEPLVATKVIRLANSVALNPSGREIADVRAAIPRVGFAAIRSLAIAVAVEQLMHERTMAPYLSRTRQLWEHSLEVAALAFVIARHVTRCNADEALFAGLVHDIGHFYLLSQIAVTPEMVDDEDDLQRVLDEWHIPVGKAVLAALEVPEPILQAVDAHETPFPDEHPTTLGEVIYLANCLAASVNPFAGTPAGHPSRASDALGLLLDDAHDELVSIISSLRD